VKISLTLVCINVILGLIKKKMKKINKKYSKLMNLIDHTSGRKEFISLLKKASYLQAEIEDIKVA